MPMAATAVESLKSLAEALTTVTGFAALTDALAQGRSATVDGAWGSSAGLATAALTLRAPTTVLVVIAHPRELDPWSGDLASFSGAPPAIFPAWDGKPGGRIDEIAGQRLRLLKQLESARPPRLVLTTIQALMQPVPDRAALAATDGSCGRTRFVTPRNWPDGWSITASRTRKPSSCRASSAGAAASSTSSHRTPRRRSVSSSSATRSNPSASSRRKRSAAWGTWTRRNSPALLVAWQTTRRSRKRR